MGRYAHLTIEDRERLQELRLDCPGISMSEIGRILGFDKSTVSRELSRNRKSSRQYQPHIAQQMADIRRSASRPARKLDNPRLRKIVKNKLEDKWSPEQIARFLGKKFPKAHWMQVSHETIYQCIYTDQLIENPEKHLRRKRRSRKRRKNRPETRGTIPDRRMIDKRPPSVSARKHFGHWEGDTIEGAGKDGYILTLVERKMRKTLAVKLDHKDAEGVADAIIRAMRRLPKHLRRSLTLDNGKEFAAHKRIEKALGIKVYFSHPHSPWERGSNENTNGLLRQYFPKKMRFSKVTKKMVDKAVRRLNNRIRKILNWRSPEEIYRRVALRP
jgi:IS30 family transposase